MENSNTVTAEVVTKPNGITIGRVQLAVIIIVVLLIGLFGGYLVMKFIPAAETGNTCTTVTPTITALVTATTTNTPSATPTPIVIPNSTDFTGKYVTAKLPAGWTIVESSDFNEETVTAGTYTGLAKLTIKYNNRDVYSLAAIHGVGGTSECEQIYKFSDTSPEYIQTQIDTNNDFNLVPSDTIIDLTQSDYTEYKLLGNTVRRVGTEVYFKNDASSNYFNPSCGMSAALRDFKGISFSTTTFDGVKYNVVSYQVTKTIPSTFTAAQLLEFDAVLQSIKSVL